MSKFPIEFLTVLVCACSVGCVEPALETNTEKEVPTGVMSGIADIAKNYNDLNLMTEEPVPVFGNFWPWCSGSPPKEAIDYGPHAKCSIKIFMNETAAAAFEKHIRYPIGSIVVKEKNILGLIGNSNDKSEGSRNGVGGMIKRENGFDTANGNWEYFYFENDAEFEFGKIESCIQCHTKAKNSDYIFGEWANHHNEINPNAPGY